MLVNGGNQPSLIIMKSGSLPHQPWKCISFIVLSSIPKEEGNGHHVGAIFPFFFLKYFESADVVLADMNLGFEWAGFLFGLWA